MKSLLRPFVENHRRSGTDLERHLDPTLLALVEGLVGTDHVMPRLHVRKHLRLQGARERANCQDNPEPRMMVPGFA